MTKILVLAEHDNNSLSGATLSVIKAAEMLGDEIDLICTTSNISNLETEISALSSVKKVHVFEDKIFENEIAENTVDCLIAVSDDYDYFLASSSTSGKNIMPRFAGLMDIQQISEVIEVVDGSTFKKPIYAGACIATVKTEQSRNVLTIRTTSFDKTSTDGGSAEFVKHDLPANNTNKPTFVKNELTVSERPELTSADIVVSGGRGMQNSDNFKLLEGIATKLNAAIGASRAAVDSGFAPNDYQVGQTGKSVAPNLYVAVGISGAIQHLAGMKASKTIVAINKDEEAPIFKVADYGLVADLFEALPELESKL